MCGFHWLTLLRAQVASPSQGRGQGEGFNSKTTASGRFVNWRVQSKTPSLCRLPLDDGERRTDRM